MKPLIFTALCLIIMATAPLKAQYNQENLTLDNKTTQKIYRHKNLQLYPIRANGAFTSSFKNLGKYVTLQEGLEKKKVIISEYQNDRTSASLPGTSIGGTVNTLYIENVSTDTIMVLSGEVVQGGKQDRVIAQDFLLYPKSGKKDVSVFCVEHGRWQSDDGNAVFEKYYNISSNKVRKAATVTKDQQEVWNKVAETTEKNDAGTSTGTLTALQKSKSLNADLSEYTVYFDKLMTEKDVIGVVAVTGDVIMGCDMFATHDMLEKNYKNLINSYATEAITSGKEVTVSYEKVKQYLKSIIEEESKQEKEVEKNGTMLKDGKRKLHISTF